MKKEEKSSAKDKCSPAQAENFAPPDTTPPQTPTRPGAGQRLSNRVGVGIRRTQTSTRQEDEQRKNLLPVLFSKKERRELSRVRQRAFSAQPLPPRTVKRQGSAPEVGGYHDTLPSISAQIECEKKTGIQEPPSNIGTSSTTNTQQTFLQLTDDGEAQNKETALTEASFNDTVDEEIGIELEQKWILNLSMQFRDKSPREKFFVTYAETPQKWRRVTVSIDYRDALPESLEADLQHLQSQRDKNARVYESIRMSLGEIQFYDTVTNLKLETRDDRLHVHVTEDVNEIISYPHLRAIKHLPIKHYRESELHFLEHMSGYVYKVEVGRHKWVKKEIPGPDSVEEFLYEINALTDLQDSRNVIELKGLVVNDERTLVKGLLIAYADQGALVDLIYDYRRQLSWDRRERWAKHIIRGLAEIHEQGYVQGDFTLSNIVVDGKDRAKIIDINRRGCPVGWEPPEISRLIENRQRISLFIGVKSDLFQLGMVLWGLIMEEDEPEIQSRPLLKHHLPEDTPDYLHEIMKICLSENPTERLAGRDLLRMFPRRRYSDSPPAMLELTGQNPDLITNDLRPPQSIMESDFAPPSKSTVMASSEPQDVLHPLSQATTFNDNDEIQFDSDGLIPKRSFTSSGSATESVTSPRGRSPSRHLAYIPSGSSYAREDDQELEPTIIPISPSDSNPKWAEITLDGTPYLIHRDTLDSLDDDDRDGDNGFDDDSYFPVDTTSSGHHGEGKGNAQYSQQSRYDDQYEEAVATAKNPGGQIVRSGARRIGSGFRGEFEHVDSGLADMDFAGNSKDDESLVKAYLNKSLDRLDLQNNREEKTSATDKSPPTGGSVTSGSPTTLKGGDD